MFNYIRHLQLWPVELASSLSFESMRKDRLENIEFFHFICY